MKLVEAEEPAKVDEEIEQPVVTPPRPPHRRVSVSLLFTLTVLVGTVVTIYLVFPNRDHVLLTEALIQARETKTPWEIVTPTATELHAWEIGLVGPEAPSIPAKVLGARRTELLDRPVAVIGADANGTPVTIVVQRSRGLGPDETRTDGDLRAITLRKGKYAMIVVGPAASEQQWASLFR